MESTTAYNERVLISATYYWDDITSYHDIEQFLHAIVALRLPNAHDRSRYVEICASAPARPDARKERIQFASSSRQSRRDVVAYQEVEEGISIREENRIQECAWKCGERYYLVHFSHDADLYHRSSR